MITPIRHIKDRLEVLHEQRDVLLAEIRNLEAEFPILEAKISENERLLASLTSHTPVGDEIGEVVPEGEIVEVPPQNGRSRMGTTQAIVAYLEQSEGAVRPVTVVNSVVDRIETSSAKPRRMVFSTLHNLVKSGRVERTAAGRVRLPK